MKKNKFLLVAFLLFANFNNGFALTPTDTQSENEAGSYTVIFSYRLVSPPTETCHQ
jgi:hypothetical protein